MTRNIKFALTITVLVILGLSFGLYSNSYAVTAADWKAGRIIDDAIFTDKDSMSVDQIQLFLNSKVRNGQCDTNGIRTSELGGGTRAQYGAANGNPIPFTCLKDFYEVPKIDPGPGIPANNYGGVMPNGAKSAARLIWDAGQRYNISPRVLLVKLGTESAGPLTSDDWPFIKQYTYAMGAHCPDSGPNGSANCDTDYAGFSIQISESARLLRWYLDSMTQPWWSYKKPYQTNSILWNVSQTGCGGSNVYIENKATAALYTYTPYQPNPAALNNMYGTGDSCSAYGNRNFWRVFNDWFGPTYAPSYAAEYVTQSPYPNLNPGQTTVAFIQIRNMGNRIWYDDTTATANGNKPIHLATTSPINRNSDFKDDSWLSDNRPSGTFSIVYDSNGNPYTSNPHSVKPGESARFEFKIKVPNSYLPGTYHEHLTVVEESGNGVIPMPVTPWLDIIVNKVVSANYASQSTYPILKPGEAKKDSFITYKNTGNTSWYDNSSAAQNNSNPVRLATMTPVNRISIFADSSWETNRDRPTGLFAMVYRSDGSEYLSNPHIVKPGESAKFQFTIQTPDNNIPGVYREYLSIIEEGGVGIINTPIIAWMDITTTDSPSARPIIDSLSEKIVRTNTLTKTYQFKNTGTTTWDSSTQLKIVSGNVTGVESSNWPSHSIAATINEATVIPGQIGTFDVTFKATGIIGSRIIKIAPAINGNSISLNDMTINIKIDAPDYTATYVSQSDYPTITQNSSLNSMLRFKNIGNVTWYDTTSAVSVGANPVVLAATNPINRLSVFKAAFVRADRPSILFNKVLKSDNITPTNNQHAADPGDIIEFKFTITAPDNLTPGVYQEFFQPIVEGGSPWNMKQIAWTNVKVTPGYNIASFYGQSNYPTVNRGGSVDSYFMFKNSGNTKWYDSLSAPIGVRPVSLATTNPINRLSLFKANFATSNRTNLQFSSVYNSDGLTLSDDQHLVQPGQIAKYSFSLKAPLGLSPGLYRESFQPILEGANQWSMQQTAWLDVTVK